MRYTELIRRAALAKRCLEVFSLLFLVLFPACPLHAQSAENPPLAQVVRDFVRIEHSTHPLTLQAREVGRVEPDRKFLRMLLMVRTPAEKEAELRQWLDQQHNPSSANYHHWLTPTEFGAVFGPDGADLQQVRSWLEQSGLTVNSLAKSGRWIEFSGSSRQVEAAFHTEMHYFELAGNRYVANSADISLPASVARISAGIVSLNNFPKHPPTLLSTGIAGITADGQKVKLTPNLTAAGNPNTYYLSPGDFAAIYNTKPLLTSGTDGSGIVIAVTGQSDIQLTDVQTFRQIFGLKTNDPNIIYSGPDPGVSTVDQQESTLDVEWAGAVAPGATIDLVLAESTDTTPGVDLAAAYAIDNSVAPIVTYTYGACEQSLQATGNAFYKALWEQAAAEGITVLVATGDNGSAACDAANPGVAASKGMSVNGAATTPFNVAVGGTEFDDPASPSTYWNATNASDYSSAIGYIPELAWNESCDPGQPTSPTNCFYNNGNFSTLADGGGVSTIYSAPSWQTGAGVPMDGMRHIPDVSLAASSGHDDFVYCNSQGGKACEINSQSQVVGLTLVGGTSASTPAMAGILALIEQKNGAFQGQVNYTLYKLAQGTGASCNSSLQTNPSAQNSCIFYDITTGSNAVPCAGGTTNCSSTQANVNGFLTGRSAGPGYDMATGLGSVNAANLANAWKNVSFVASTTQLQMPTRTFAHGTAVTVSGTVAPVSGTATPTGIVSLKTDTYGVTKDVLPLTNGAFSNTTIRDLPGGQYMFSAHYGGDGTFAASDSAAVTLTVTPEASTTTLTANGLQAGGAPYGDLLELIITVQGASGAGAATGSLRIQEGATTVGNYPLASDGTAHIFTGSGASASFSVGAHSLTAAYSGDNSFNASNSAVLLFTIGKSSPLVIVGLNTTAVTSTEPIGAHVAVSGLGNATATGTVQFTVDGVPYNSAIPLQTGGFFGSQAQASTLITGGSAGPHVIGVDYLATANGVADPNYLSVPHTDTMHEPNQPSVTISKSAGIPTTTTLVAQTLPLNIGDTGVFKVTVSPASATGTVSLWDAVGSRTSDATITGGTATISFPWTQGGTTSLYAIYSGDATNAVSSSTATTFTVKPGAAQIALTGPSQANALQQISLVGSVTGLTSSGKAAGATLAYPTGIVEFLDSLNGGAAQLLSTQMLTVGAGNIGVFGLRAKLPVGTHTLTMHYGGDNNWRPGDSPAITINTAANADFSLTLSPNAIAISAGMPGTTNVDITPIGGFTGTVSLSCPSGTALGLVGYNCAIAPPSVNVTNAISAVPTLTLSPNPAPAAAVRSASLHPASPTNASRISTAPIIFLLTSGIFLLAIGALRITSSTRVTRQLAFASGSILCVISLIAGCGGGGGGGGGPVPSTTTLMSTNLRAAYQTPVTFSVKVTSNSTAGGTVNLIDNGQMYTSGTVIAGVASFQTTTLPVGVHVVSAQYLGDANTRPSSSTSITQVITGSLPMDVTATSGAITHTATLTVQLN